MLGPPPPIRSDSLWLYPPASKHLRFLLRAKDRQRLVYAVHPDTRRALRNKIDKRRWDAAFRVGGRCHRRRAVKKRGGGVAVPVRCRSRSWSVVRTRDEAHAVERLPADG